MIATLQRKCGGDGCCDDCDRKKKLQRSALGPASQLAPPIVHDVLRAPGEPLDRATRVAMEPRFAHDFSRVRVHRDAHAAASAAAVNARAYTVGHNVVLGRNATRDVMAHELAHVIQQEGASESGALTIGRADDPLEHEADRMIAGGAQSSGNSPRVVRRSPEDTQKAGQELSPDDTTLAKKIVGDAETAGAEPVAPKEKGKAKPKEKAKPPDVKPRLVESKESKAAGALMPVTNDVRFILHDTSSPVGADGIKAQVDENRGPLGKGVNAWVPREGAATITRPFYESHRPTTTDWEKGLDALSLPTDTAKGGALADLLKKRRDDQFRKVWALVDPKVKRVLIEFTLSSSQLTPAELKKEVEGYDKIKDKKKEHVPGAMEQLDDPKVKDIYTSATWTIELICSAAGLWSVFANMLALPGKGADLEKECAVLRPYFLLRNQRVGSTVTTEISAPGVSAEGKKENFKNTCSPNNPKVAQFSTPPYSPNQYANVRALYLRAALRANRFPTITTHKLVDEKFGGHCDPRCFNLGHLYEEIQTALKHPAGTQYGVPETYGTADGRSIWWDWKSAAKGGAAPYNVCPEKPPK